MTDFKDTLAKFTSTLSFQEKGKFSSQPQQNPKGQYNSNTSSSRSQHMDQVQSVITLHSGKVIEKPILEPCEKDDESISEGKKGVKPEHCKEKTDSSPIWIKSNQSLLPIMIRLLKNPFLNLVRKMMSQSLRVRKGLNLNIAKKRLIPHQYFHFLMP